jgi:nicotianamine synthase
MYDLDALMQAEGRPQPQLHKHEVAGRIQQIHSLVRDTSLAPSPHLAGIFNELIGLTTRAHSPETVAGTLLAVGPILPEFRSLQSQAEYLLECDWAKKVAASPDPLATLLAFPYYDGYAQLTAVEHGALTRLTGHPLRTATFAGSGPLPLTAILLARAYGLASTCVEREEEAVRLSRQAVRALGLQAEIQIVQADIADLPPLRTDAVFLAALAGHSDQEKQGLVRALHDRISAGCLLCARTVEGLGAVHYYPLQPGELRPFKVLEVARPPWPAVNVSLIASPC